MKHVDCGASLFLYMSQSHDHAHGHSHAYTAKTEKKPGSMAVLTVEVPEETLAAHRAFAVQSIANHVTIDGFRKGHVPEKVLVEKVGEMAILTEAADITISHLYPHILKDQKLDAIGSPKVTITKLAPQNPLHFTIEIALVPEVDLPDYMKIAQKQNGDTVNVDVTDSEVDEAVTRVQRQKLAYDRLQNKAKARAEADAAGLTLPTPDSVDAPIETEEDFAKLPLPELTDEYVKTLGGFENVQAFKDEIRKHMATEKENEATSKRRAALTDAIIDGTKIDLPAILVNSELNQMFAEMESDIARAGMKMEDYLEHVKKTREDLAKEWTPIAEKRAKLQLVLNEIAKRENVKPDEARVATEMSALLQRFPDANPERTRMYVETVLTNEAVIEMLEKA
jgi:trigger factor